MQNLNFLDPQSISILIQLLVAMLLGTILGIERTIAHKTAGMRTYALISTGAALFVIISEIIFLKYASFSAINPLLLPAQIVVGIGFIGGGLIFVHGNTVKGLTTAAGLWVMAGIGMAVGYKLYTIAIFATILTLFIFKVLWRIEDQIKHFVGTNDECTIDHKGEVKCKGE
ncbi:MAG: MgtC/SapB transporter [Parcubacteria group bacterium GW2011_GWF2_38_76]|nr:MAG: MgtC/SapB transporter [Parcubacteria group bacterium GW2011_GWF2_38_76]HBM45921.1 magnesium transporter MgtC [Patescibacteria group bacterium]